MSDLSLNFPQDQEEYLTHNRCSLKGLESTAQFQSQRVQGKESFKFGHLESDLEYASYS